MTRTMEHETQTPHRSVGTKLAIAGLALGLGGALGACSSAGGLHAAERQTLDCRHQPNRLIVRGPDNYGVLWGVEVVVYTRQGNAPTVWGASKYYRDDSDNDPSKPATLYDAGFGRLPDTVHVPSMRPAPKDTLLVALPLRAPVVNVSTTDNRRDIAFSCVDWKDGDPSRIVYSPPTMYT